MGILGGKDHAERVSFKLLEEDQQLQVICPAIHALPSAVEYDQVTHVEIEVPPVLNTNDDNQNVISTADMPVWCEPFFRGITDLSRIESRIYKTAIQENCNLLISAPTGAGNWKLNVSVLVIAKQLSLLTSWPAIGKVVYIAPLQSVASVFSNLSNRMPENIEVRDLSCCYQELSLTCQHIEEAQVLVTTAEDWDLFSRMSGDPTYGQQIKLFIFDDLLINSRSGPALEAIVARIFSQMKTRKEHVRLVGFSPPVRNYEDVAKFLKVTDEGLFTFDNSYRNVPVSQRYIGVKETNPSQRLEVIKDLCYQKVMAAAEVHQVLIFVYSANKAAETAHCIRNSALANGNPCTFLKEVSPSNLATIKSTDLKELLQHGFAIHHVGLNSDDRKLVENLFANGHVKVLVSTPMLAWDVNLPAHTVIIQGGTELSPLDVMQILGCAGRPEYDSQGEVIVITDCDTLRYYQSLMNCQFFIESKFMCKLADMLNAEIVLGTVQDVIQASNWLKETYMFIRLLKEPALYGFVNCNQISYKELEDTLVHLIHLAASILHENKLIKYDTQSTYFQATDLGYISSYNYVTYGTIAKYNEYLKPHMGDIDLFWLFSVSEEFRFVEHLKEKDLQRLLSSVPIPVMEGRKEPSATITVMLQAYISCWRLEWNSLTSHMDLITQSARRLLQAIFEICLKRGLAQPAERALNLCKMVKKRMWSAQTPLRQFNDVPNDILMKLERNDLSWERYCGLSSKELEKPAELIHESITWFPKVKLAANLKPINRAMLRVEVTITLDFQWNDNVHGNAEKFWVLVEDNDREYILHHDSFSLKKQGLTLNFTVPICEPLPTHYFVHVLSDRWLGSQTVLPVSFRGLILPSKVPPPANLQNLPIDPSYELVGIGLSHSYDNALVAAPSGSGRVSCAEFAICRLSRRVCSVSSIRAVYIAPTEVLAEARLIDWKSKFGKEVYKLSVVKLTGNKEEDMVLFQRSNIVICTPEKWEYLSRDWRDKSVQGVGLFIIDQLHLIGSEGGQTLELIISRMRYITRHSKQMRIVGLSTSLANANDLGEWIGAASHCLINFPPLETHIRGVDLSNFESRKQTITKPIYNDIIRNGTAALVYVPTREHVQLTADDLSAYSNADSRVFVLKIIEKYKRSIDNLSDENLRCTLLNGVGYCHEGLTASDKSVVIELFVLGYIQVCVLSSSMCWDDWGPTLSAGLVVVVVMGRYDDAPKPKSLLTDYPGTDLSLSQMMGHASCNGKCLIICHEPSKIYYSKFLNKAVPVESLLIQFLDDILDTEYDAQIIASREAALTYLSEFTFFGRRLRHNPTYYNVLQGVAPMEYLSHLVDNWASKRVSKIKMHRSSC